MKSDLGEGCSKSILEIRFGENEFKIGRLQ
jgi:hypothetical protein